MVGTLIPPGKKPPSLNKGDRIRIISPAGPITADSLGNTVSFLEVSGYNVDVGAHAFDKQDFLAGSDDFRLNDLVEALFDQSVKAILCSRGGYGSQRLLSRIPWESLINIQPKIFIGFSDIGALQTSLWQKAGWSSYSGLQAANGFNSASNDNAQRQFLSILSKCHNGRFVWPESNAFVLKPLITGGCAGVFYPVCLSILCSLIGTPFQPDLHGVVLCLEDVGEAPYRIDRLFWQLANSDLVDELGGVVLGSFLYGDQSIFDSVAKSAITHLEKFDFPIWTGIPYGHFDDRFTLPFAVNSSIDTEGALYFD